MTNRPILVLESRVSPGMCDINGHMNVAHYAQFFDSASWAMLDRLAPGSAELSWADVTHRTEFRKEVHARHELAIHSGVVRIGRKSLAILNTMIVKESGDVAAINEVVSVRFDLLAREAVALEERTSATAREYLLEPEPTVFLRS